eukprot:5936298-Alexandrium_andersonii.AAC.1
MGTLQWAVVPAAAAPAPPAAPFSGTAALLRGFLSTSTASARSAACGLARILFLVPELRSARGS